ncbi:MAG: hypothetical protein O3C34_06770, partial [Proteobacteria bacterium]|nr:hypothetical protein [Pseudomonadota bacterium]
GSALRLAGMTVMNKFVEAESWQTPISILLSLNGTFLGLPSLSDPHSAKDLDVSPLQRTNAAQLKHRAKAIWRKRNF